MDGVYNMLLSREERHEAAWGAFVEMKDANKKAKQEDLNRTLTTFKRNLGVTPLPLCLLVLLVFV